MSLSSFIKISDINERFQKEFIMPPFMPPIDLQAKKISTDDNLIESSFKYLMNFILELINPNIITDPWVADYSLEMACIRGADDYFKKASRLVEETRRNLSIYKSMNQEHANQNSALLYGSIIESAFYLAQIDAYFYTGGEDIQKPLQNDLVDLKRLISLVKDKDFKSQELCLWRPSFGEASRLVGGAEIDLILDDAIIQIEMTEAPTIKREVFDNLMGLYCLYQIGGVPGIDKKHHIKKVGIYFARYGYLQLIPTESVLNSRDFLQFLNWFEERACQEFG